MNYYSTRNNQVEKRFDEAVLEGLLPDGGLFLPREIPKLPLSFFYELPNLRLPEIAFEVLRPFVSDCLEDKQIRTICEKAFSFPIPIKTINDRLKVMELFHGPTLAFKDVGARFMAQLVHALTVKNNQDNLIVVATSGDTGSAVAQAFYQAPHSRVVVLYPKGKISALQERQFATLGKNVQALAVAGTFDDCQHLAKALLQDCGLKAKYNLISANSINLGRLLPQMVYYFEAYKHQFGKPLSFSVPSGNFGNLTAGILAKKLGLPVQLFIAATNVNDVVPAFLNGKDFQERTAVQTLASAMDVGAPSNFERLRSLLGNSREEMQRVFTASPATDAEIVNAIKVLWKDKKYLIDPHTAAGVVAWDKVKDAVQGTTVILATAHPAKFPETVEGAVGERVTLPEALTKHLKRPILSTEVAANKASVLQAIGVFEENSVAL